MITRKQLEHRRERLLRFAPDLAQILRGSLFERRRRCGQPNCHCAQGEGHLSVYVGVSMPGGKNAQVTVPAKLVPLTTTWTENYKHLWDIIEEVSAINRELLQRRLVDGSDDDPAASKRGRK